MEEGPANSGMPSGTPSGTDRGSDRQEVYTVSEAAKVLGITTRRVRQLAQDGKVEGIRTDEGWKLFRYSVHSFRDSRGKTERPTEPLGSSLKDREHLDRVAALERQLGRLEGRLELTERAESTVREERDRLARLLDEEREERQRLQLELEQSRRSWWRRFFGLE